LEAVFKDRVEALCARAGELLAAPDPGRALAIWLRAGAHAVANRGLGVSLMREAEPGFGATCHDMIAAAGDALLVRAGDAVRPGVTISQLLKLVGAIALATEQDADGPAEADLLFGIAIDGVRAR
jgi:hypothetical protein